MVVLHDLQLGGTERIAIRLANRWAALIDTKVEVIECNPAIRRGRGSRVRLGSAAANFAAERMPDVVFVPGNFHWPIVPALKRLPHDVRPAIVAQISSPLFKPGRIPLRQIAYNVRVRWQLSGADRLVSLSPRTTREANAILGRAVTGCIRLPALEDELQPLQPADGKLIVAVGRLAPEKGFDIALRAFALLQDKETRLAIVGDGPLRGSLMALARTLGVADRVAFPGYVSDVRPWLRRARAFLLSSHYEGYCAALVEALAAGRPVIATACTPATGELLTLEEAGGVSPVGDFAKLAANMQDVLSAEPPDPDRLAALVDGYRIGPITEAYLNLFETLRSRTPRARFSPFAVTLSTSNRNNTGAAI